MGKDAPGHPLLMSNLHYWVLSRAGRADRISQEGAEQLKKYQSNQRLCTSISIRQPIQLYYRFRNLSPDISSYRCQLSSIEKATAKNSFPHHPHTTIMIIELFRLIVKILTTLTTFPVSLATVGFAVGFYHGYHTGTRIGVASTNREQLRPLLCAARRQR